MRKNTADYIDLKAIFDKISRKWPLFLMSFFFTLSLAYLYLITTPNLYEVRATLQLKDESLSDKGIGNEKFISGLELLEGSSELEDEIGILSSHKMVDRALDGLYFDVSLYSFDNRFNFLGERISEEVYKGPIEIILNHSSSKQIIHAPIHIEFVDSTRVKLEVDSENVAVLDMVSQEITSNEEVVILEEEFSLADGYKSDLLSFDIFITPEYEVSAGEKYYFVINNRESLLKQYSSKLSIATISKQSNIVSLSSRGRTPTKEIDFVNKLMEVYIDHNLQKKSQLGLKTVEFIDRQLSTVYDSLVNVETSLEAFRSSNQIIDIGTTSTELTVQLQRLEEESSELRVQREFYVYILNELKRSRDLGEIAPSSVGINNSFLNDQLLELANLNKEKIDKSFSSKPNSPVILVLDEKIDNAKKLLIDNINNLIKSTNISLNNNHSRTRQLQSKIDALPESERDLINIEREFALNDNIYNYLLQKRAEASIALASNLPDKAVVDTARKIGRKPVSPNTFLIIAIAVTFGLALPLAFIVVGDFLNTKVQSEKELVELFGKSAILSGPHLKSKQITKQVKNIDPVPAKTFRFLAIDLMNKCDLSKESIIAFTSAQKGSGVSLCAYNLALTFAAFGKHVVYLDLDFHKKKKSYQPISVLKVNDLSLIDYFYNNEKDVEDYNIINSTDNLYVIPSGEQRSGVDDMAVVFKDKIHDLLKYLSQNFDFVIVDTPSVLDHIDFSSLAKMFDLKVLVTRHNHTKKAHLKKASVLLSQYSKSLELVYNDFG